MHLAFDIACGAPFNTSVLLLHESRQSLACWHLYWFCVDRFATVICDDNPQWCDGRCGGLCVFPLPRGVRKINSNTSDRNNHRLLSDRHTQDTQLRYKLLSLNDAEAYIDMKLLHILVRTNSSSNIHSAAHKRITLYFPGVSQIGYIIIIWTLFMQHIKTHIHDVNRGSS